MNGICVSIGLAAALGLAGASLAQTGYSITGAMSNFDIVNRCDYPCDELEVEIEDIRPEDVLHTYRNSNYGLPTVTLSPTGGSTLVNYRSPQHLTNVNTIEHFGITIKGAGYYVPAVYHRTHVRWYRSGHLATVNGLLPTEGGTSAPAAQPLQPSIGATINQGSHGQGGATLTLVNNDPTQSIWVKRRVQVRAGTVTLEALMPNDPLVTSTIELDAAPVRVGPGQTITAGRDLGEIEEVQSVVFTARYFQNLVTVNPDPFDPSNGERVGPELGNIMTATEAAPLSPCAHHPASIDEHPASVNQPANSRVDLRVRAHGDDTSPLTYQWMHEGVPLTDGDGFSGTDTAHLRIDSLTPDKQGFYCVRVVNECINTISDSALVFINGVNVPPRHQRDCPGDYDHQDGRSVDDIFMFLNDWFRGMPGADYDRHGGRTVDDIFVFLGDWFTAC